MAKITDQIQSVLGFDDIEEPKTPEEHCLAAGLLKADLSKHSRDLNRFLNQLSDKDLDRAINFFKETYHTYTDGYDDYRKLIMYDLKTCVNYRYLKNFYHYRNSSGQEVPEKYQFTSEQIKKAVGDTNDEMAVRTARNDFKHAKRHQKPFNSALHMVRFSHPVPKRLTRQAKLLNKEMFNYNVKTFKKK